MSERINTNADHISFRRQLLTTVSVLALIGSAYGMNEAAAADTDGDNSTVWIELGGQLSRLDDSQDIFAPPVMAARPSMFDPSQKFERMPPYSIDETAKILFEPDGSNWFFSVSARYGRSDSKKDVNQQTYPKPHTFYVLGNLYTQAPIAARFANTSVRNDEHHLIADFQAGKDVGLGMFGAGSSSVFNVGVRFAQFSTNSNIALKSDPDWHRLYKYLNYPSFHITNVKFRTAEPYHINTAGIRAARSFHGIGPSLSWNASAPFLGSAKEGEVAFDLGLNAAFLFGRQRAKVHHQTTAQYHVGTVGGRPGATRTTLYRNTPPDKTRSRMVTVPNVGGFAGLTFRIENFKMSAGYRADLFFGAMDGGIDAAKKENRGFYGPFANVSVGIGG